MDPDFPKPFNPNEPPQPSSSSTPLSRLTPATTATSSTPTRLPIPPSSSHHNNSKRKRGLGVVTPNACTECRKKRAKCDGQEPCGRCQAQTGVECIYEVPIRQSKENLRTEIESLRHRQQSSDTVLAALIRPQLWEDVLNRLRNGESVENISDWLAEPLSETGGSISSGGTLPMAAQPSSLISGPRPGTTSLADFSHTAPGTLSAINLAIGNLPTGITQQQQQQHPHHADLTRGGPWDYTNSDSYSDPMTWVPDLHATAGPSAGLGAWSDHDALASELPRFHGLEQILAPLEVHDPQSAPITWTVITNDIRLVHHLLALYFCWEYPTFASLSKEHFLHDFRDGHPRFCSPILVNALLALGCRFSTHPMTRANPNDAYTSGDHFFQECQRLFYRETDHHSLTTIQALGIMSIREASCGRDSESWYYAGQSVRLAIEMGLHRISGQGDQDELAVKSATFWGAFALDHAWSLATGSLPQCSCFPHLPPKPAIIDDVEASLWVPYTDNGASMNRRCEQQSNVRSVYKCFCELSELVHQSLYILHSPGRPLTARDLLGIYTQYLNWYDQIPEVLRLGHNFTPAVLFAHMYYHFAILLLFRPLIKLRITGSKVTPRDVCLQAAEAISSLLKSYSQLYTLRRTPSFVPYFVLTSAIMHLALGASNPDQPGTMTDAEAAQSNPRVSAALRQGIADLTEMAPCHNFAEQALNILRYLAKKWNIDVNISESEQPAPQDDRFVKPYTSSLNFFAPDIREEDFSCDWGYKAPAPGTLDELTSIQQSGDNMENPLFWPFPMQGRPILPVGKELERAGFEPL